MKDTMKQDGSRAAPGSAQGCEWIITSNKPFRQCSDPGAMYDPQSGTVYCVAHSEAFEDCFGDAILRSLPPNSVLSRSP